MSGDEVFLTLASVIAAFRGLIRWYWSLARLGAARQTGWLAALPLALLAALFVVLRRWASFDVRDSGIYLTLYMIVGAGWLGLWILWLPLFGMSPRDDTMERKNAAAAFATGGALPGLMACFAGGNVGDGPGWWVVFFAAGLATITLWTLWVILDRQTRITDRITIDRDTGSGIRGGAFLAASGCVLGRAVAGNWVSAKDTLIDFAMAGWPAILLLGAAIACEKIIQPNYRLR